LGLAQLLLAFTVKVGDLLYFIFLCCRPTSLPKLKIARFYRVFYGWMPTTTNPELACFEDKSIIMSIVIYSKYRAKTP